MKKRKSIYPRVIQIASIIGAFTLAPSAMAVCVPSNPEAELVFTVDANNGCESINNHFGCHIKNPPGSCDFFMQDENDETVGFTVTSQFNTDPDDPDYGQLEWTTTQYPGAKQVGIDVAVVGGAIKGNNCGYGFEFDVISGSGGDCKGTIDVFGNCDGAIQNITGLDVCTDLEDEVPPPPPVVPPVATTLKACQTQEQTVSAMFDALGKLDRTGIQCPEYALGDDIPVGKQTGDQKPVVVCNLEKDKYAWGTTGANEDGAQEEVCCQCGIEMDVDQTCFVSDNPEENAENGCAETLTSDPTQEVILKFQRDNNDPCTKIVSGGKTYKTCW